MIKAELHAHIDSMTEEEAAEVKLIFAPDWPSKATSIEEIRKRTGTVPMSSEAFDRHFGSLATGEALKEALRTSQPDDAWADELRELREGMDPVTDPWRD
ncbi:MAG TPA: hypothetical protein VF081_07295 [Solirubrobacterales bacterium]